jgi:hypothetical protein
MGPAVDDAAAAYALPEGNFRMSLLEETGDPHRYQGMRHDAAIDS